MQPPTESAVVVAVQAAEPVVGDHRRHLDASAAKGVPAHVTVLYPFVPPALLDAEVRQRLAAAVGTVAAFDCDLVRCAWFGDDVLWLAPEPDQGFRDLTAAVTAAFPHQRPYGGAYDEVTPHLTVGGRGLGTSVDALRAVETAVAPLLPVAGRVDRALLIAGSDAPGSWRTLASLALAQGLRSH